MRYVGQKVVQLVAVLLLVTFLTFLLLTSCPAGRRPRPSGSAANEEQIEEFRAEQHLDDPLMRALRPVAGQRRSPATSVSHRSPTRRSATC